MENLIEAAKKLKDRRQVAIDKFKTRYNELLKQEKELEAYLDDNSIPIEERQAKMGEFKVTLKQLNELLIELIHAGHYLKREEVLNGFIR